MAINSCIPAVTLRKLKLNLHIAMVKSLNKNYLDVVEKRTDSGVLLFINFKKNVWSLFMDGVQLSKGCRATTSWVEIFTGRNFGSGLVQNL